MIIHVVIQLHCAAQWIYYKPVYKIVSVRSISRYFLNNFCSSFRAGERQLQIQRIVLQIQRNSPMASLLWPFHPGPVQNTDAAALKLLVHCTYISMTHYVLRGFHWQC